MTKLVIQIPAYNEAETLPIALAELPRQIEGVDEIKGVIDDSSSDTLPKSPLRTARITSRHRQNRGFARFGSHQFSLALGADIIVNTMPTTNIQSTDIPRAHQSRF